MYPLATEPFFTERQQIILHIAVWLAKDYQCPTFTDGPE